MGELTPSIGRATLSDMGGRRKKDEPKPVEWVEIGLRLKAARLALEQEDQRAYAKAAGVAQNTYNQHENGQRRISVDAALKLCSRYGITLDWIYRANSAGLPSTILGKLPPPEKLRVAS